VYQYDDKGVGLVLRNMANVEKPTVEFVKSNDTWRMITSTTFKNVELEFKIGEEFAESTSDGRKCLAS
jgi:hydroxypyruvate isomerase